MSFVLGASMALAWCFEDEGGAYAEGVLEALRHEEAFVASLWPLEVSNGLLTAERRGRIGPQEAARVARLLLALPISETRRLARAHGLSSYDAAYLELAARMGRAPWPASTRPSRTPPESRAWSGSRRLPPPTDLRSVAARPAGPSKAPDERGSAR